MYHKKTCLRCNESKALHFFHKNIRQPDERHYYCAKCMRAHVKAYHRKHPDKNRQRVLRWQKENKDKHNAKNRAWNKAHPEHRRARNNARIINQRLRTPSWAKRGAIAKQIREFYLNRPEGFEVDHIIPLYGDFVSGLHVPWNLQYLTSKQNREKSNHFAT